MTYVALGGFDAYHCLSHLKTQYLFLRGIISKRMVANYREKQYTVFLVQYTLFCPFTWLTK